MAKFNEYTQKATPADNDTMMIYDATAKANKLSPFSGIWNWIVGKLTNAVISNLQTNNKSVVGALNELNSNRLTFVNINARMAISNDKVEIIFDSIADTERGVVVITGYISGGVIFSALVSYGTKWSVKLISFNASNARASQATIDGVNKKIQFTVTTTIQATESSVSAKLIK